MNNQELIIIEQLPVITERLKVLSDDIDKKVSEALALVCNDKTLQDVKSVRAQLNKDFGELEAKRKDVKKAVLAPYEAFESVYKNYVSDKFNGADTQLKAKIGAVEKELRDKKMEQVRAYYDEYATAQGVSEYSDFDRDISKLRTSLSINEFQRISRDCLDTTALGLKAIDAQPEEIRAEVLAEFKKTHNAPEAISIVSSRHKAIEEAKKQRAEREQREKVEAETVKRVEVVLPPLAPPAQAPKEDDPIRTVAFKVTAPISKLRELKAFLKDGGYQYE